MTDPNELGVALTSIANALQALNVPWAVVGSLASSVHGEPRATNDLDIVADLALPNAKRLGELLGSDFYFDEDAAFDAVRRSSSFNIIDNRNVLKIDIFVPKEGPMGTGQLDRRQFLEIVPGVGELPVLGPEDVILQKLRWYQMGGEISDRQWRDILSVVRNVGEQLDRGYLETVAQMAGLRSLLDRALREQA